MADKTEKFDEFLDEIQNDIRQEKYAQLWQRYGKIITSSVTGVIALVAAFVLWNNYTHKKQLELSDNLFQAQNYIFEGKVQEAIALLDHMHVSGDKTYGYLRDFQKASLLLHTNEKEKQVQASALYEEISKNTHITQPVRDIATLMCAKAKKMLNTPLGDIQALLEPLLKEGAPWRLFALEFLAQSYFEDGQKEKALENFAEIARSSNAPEGVMLRAQLMVQVLNNEGNR